MPCLTCKKYEKRKVIGGTVKIGMRGCSTRESCLQEDNLKVLHLALGCHANGIFLLLSCKQAARVRDSRCWGWCTVQCFLSRAGPCVKCAWKRGR
jgi:hypothetical protein